jgi:hypothetical protein
MDTFTHAPMDPWTHGHMDVETARTWTDACTWHEHTQAHGNGYGMHTWIWSHGYGHMDMVTWIWSHGYGHMDMVTWIWSHGHGQCTWTMGMDRVAD